MFAQFLSIVFRSIKLDKNLYRESKSFSEAGIYFAALIMVLDGVAGAIAANTFYKTSVGLSAITGVQEAQLAFDLSLSLIHISQPTRPRLKSYAVFC